MIEHFWFNTGNYDKQLKELEDKLDEGYTVIASINDNGNNYLLLRKS